MPTLALPPLHASPAALAQVHAAPTIDPAIYREALDIIAELAQDPHTETQREYLVHRAARLCCQPCPVHLCDSCEEEAQAAADDLAGCYGSTPR